jgi:PIN domain nuclease of toxin-antitoxin system
LAISSAQSLRSRIGRTNEGKHVILLDTHVLYWMANDSKRLSRRARETIREARQERHAGIAIATITVWELAWLAQNGRIELSVSVESFVRELVARVILRPVTPEIAALSVRLPNEFPKDPADRLIAATSMVEGMRLVTADARIRQSKVVETVW